MQFHCTTNSRLVCMWKFSVGIFLLKNCNAIIFCWSLSNILLYLYQILIFKQFCQVSEQKFQYSLLLTQCLKKDIRRFLRIASKKFQVQWRGRWGWFKCDLLQIMDFPNKKNSLVIYVLESSCFFFEKVSNTNFNINEQKKIGFLRTNKKRKIKMT